MGAKSGHSRMGKYQKEVSVLCDESYVGKLYRKLMLHWASRASCSEWSVAILCIRKLYYIYNLTVCWRRNVSRHFRLLQFRYCDQLGSANCCITACWISQVCALAFCNACPVICWWCEKFIFLVNLVLYEHIPWFWNL